MLKKLGRRCNELRHGDRLDREARDELALHLELAVAEKVRAGADASEARRQARLELGDAEEARERLREGRAGFWLDSVRKDAACALRMLRKRPGFSAVCVLTIGLGVGASTALFAVVDAVVLRPLPLPDPASLVAIYDTNPSLGVERSGVAPPSAGPSPEGRRPRPSSTPRRHRWAPIRWSCSPTASGRGASVQLGGGLGATSSAGSPGS